MHRFSARVLAVASAATLLAIGFAGPAAAHGGHGGKKPAPPPFSIQAAVDAAKPGATIHIPPGTYRETVTITKDGITLKGHKVVIAPPADAVPTPCDVPPEGPPPTVGASGICILGSPEDRVSGVSVRGVSVYGAVVHGLIAIGSKDLSVRDSRFTDNGGYGAASFDTEGTTFRDNKATGNLEAGFYVGDSPNSKADVRGNYSADNELGFFFRNASYGKAQGNVAEGNCIGVLVLADAPGPATDWKIRDNKVNANNKVCPPNEAEGIPPLSGAGIVLSGAQKIHVEDNTVRDNASAAASLAKGGIVVVSGFGGTAPSAHVEDNRLKGNQPADLVWDGSGTVRFDDNKCRTSTPPGLCG